MGKNKKKLVPLMVTKNTSNENIMNYLLFTCFKKKIVYIYSTWMHD